MKLSKALEKLPASVLEEIFAVAESGSLLDRIVSHSEAAIAKATKERDANPEYQKAKQACKDLSEGLKEVKNFQKAKATVALAILDVDGSRDEEESSLLDDAQNRVQEDQRKRKKAS